MEEKKSFLGSVMDGIGGFIKGAFTGGAIGAIGGAAIAAVGALVFPGAAETLLTAITASTGAGAAVATNAIANVGIVGLSTITGAVAGASTFGAVGGYSGMATEVIRGREAGQVSGEDVANVAKISYAQGVMVGHNIAQEQQAEVSTKFRDKVMQQRAQTQQAQKTH